MYNVKVFTIGDRWMEERVDAEVLVCLNISQKSEEAVEFKTTTWLSIIWQFLQTN